MSGFQLRWLALVWAGFSCTLYAVDGVVLIDQNRALAGNVTPGDAAGFPVTISVSGSYRLSGNLTVPDINTSAILVTADNVTIDLNGFSIIGPVVCSGFPATCNQTGTGFGIDARQPPLTNLTIANGTVRGMGSDGIAIIGQSGSIEKVHAHSNGGNGLVPGAAGMVRDSTSLQNGNIGIVVGSGLATGNIVRGNGGAGGMFVFCPSTVIGNTVQLNNGGNIVISGSSAGCALANNAAP